MHSASVRAHDGVFKLILDLIRRIFPPLMATRAEFSRFSHALLIRQTSNRRDKSVLLRMMPHQYSPQFRRKTCEGHSSWQWLL
jgi:hypothetical protein